MRIASRHDAASNLEKLLHCLELRDRLGELAGEELVEQLVHGKRRILEAPALIAHCCTYSTGVDVEQVTDELIEMLCLDPISSERVFRKVLEVVSALHIDGPDKFVERFDRALETAVPLAEIAREAENAETAEAWAICKELAKLPNILSAFTRDLESCGVVGESRNAAIIYLALNSRFLGHPVSVDRRAGSAESDATAPKRLRKRSTESARHQRPVRVDGAQNP